MNINDAAKVANNTGRGITRKSWGKRPIMIIPTNTVSCCIVNRGGQFVSSRWNPNLSDLLAKDWIVYG